MEELTVKDEAQEDMPDEAEQIMDEIVPEADGAEVQPAEPGE